MKQLDATIIVNNAIVETLNIKLEDIKEDSTLESLGADSLDVVPLNILLEDRFNTEIDDDDVSIEATVKDLTIYIKELVEVNNE